MCDIFLKRPRFPWTGAAFIIRFAWGEPQGGSRGRCSPVPRQVGCLPGLGRGQGMPAAQSFLYNKDAPLRLGQLTKQSMQDQHGQKSISTIAEQRAGG